MGFCKNCQAELNLNYCPNCGLPGSLNRIDGQYLLGEFRNALNFERGFLYTVRELVLHPGKSIRGFLSEDRSRMVRPVVFLILTSIIYSVLNNFLHFEATYASLSANNDSATLKIFQWVQGNYGYANILMAAFIGIWVKIFFNKHQFNFFEILVLLCYVMGIGMLIFAFFGIFQSLTGPSTMQVAGFFGFGYTTWAIGQFFGKGEAINYINAFLSYMLGVFTFTIMAFMIGISIDLLS